MVSTVVRRERVGDADGNRRIHGNEIRIPVAARAAALDRSRDPTVLLYFTRLHVRPYHHLPTTVTSISDIVANLIVPCDRVVR